MAARRPTCLGGDPKPEMVDLFSNEKQVTDKTPPMFLAHAKDDTLVAPDNSRMLYEALKARTSAGGIPGTAQRRPRAEWLQGADVGRLANQISPMAGCPEVDPGYRCQSRARPVRRCPASWETIRVWSSETRTAPRNTPAFDEVAYRRGSPGRVFKLSEDALSEYLDGMESRMAGAMTTAPGSEFPW